MPASDLGFKSNADDRPRECFEASKIDTRAILRVNRIAQTSDLCSFNSVFQLKTDVKD